MFNSYLYACRLKSLPSWNMWDRVGEMNWLNTWGTMYFTKLYIRPIPPKWTLYRGFIKNGLCKNGKIKLPKLQEISIIINYHHVKVEDHIKPTLCPHLLGKNLPSDLTYTHTHIHTMSSFCFTEQAKLEVDYEKIWQQKIQFYGFNSFCIVTLSKKCI